MPTTFGLAKGYSSHRFTANYKGPLFPVNMLAPTSMKLTATHEDRDASLGLIFSAQALTMDASVTPHRVSGEASFFTENGSDMLFCDFSGIVVDRDSDGEPDKATVHVVFKGGTGRFIGATGTGAVEADLHPELGFSQGRIEADVYIPDR
jgi:hypothetical protein